VTPDDFLQNEFGGHAVYADDRDAIVLDTHSSALL
jgi:hypothetical protein